MDTDPGVRVSAVRSLADLARIHRQLDLGPVLESLRVLESDPFVAPYVTEALEDIAIFISPRL